MSLTPVVEEYLATIYMMTFNEQPVIAARLAEKLKVSPPTVTERLHRLAQDNLIKISSGRGIILTDMGKEIAERTLRRHFLTERLLTDILGLAWHEVHEEAGRLEHYISPKVEEKLAAILGNPTTCPHGNPLPGTSAASRPKGTTLDRLRVGESARVVRVTEEAENDPKLLEYLEDNAIVPGTTLTVVEVESFNDALIVICGKERVRLGLRAATTIWVWPLQEALSAQHPIG